MGKGSRGVRARRRWERLPKEFGNEGFEVTSPFSHAEQSSETRRIYKDYGKVYFVLPTAFYVHRSKQSGGFLK